MAILGLLPALAVAEGSILFQNEDLLQLNESQLRAIRGARIALIHQEPGLALSPVMRIGSQIGEVIRAHSGLRRKQRQQEARAMLQEVCSVEADRIYRAYPNHLSGGELHRVAIAQALACRPSLIIADESTRSLDVTAQVEILNLLRDLNRRFGTALIFITHNPALLAGFAHRVIVMYAGRIVEQGRLPQVFRSPLHPYTRQLLQLVPRSLRNGLLGADRCSRPLAGLPGDTPSLSQGCAFETPCSERNVLCGSNAPRDWT